jgi:guanine nucleotide-binding protein alpha-1 subunit
LLAPISCYDENLAEDPSINHLQDSFILWKSIYSAKMLGSVTLVVFLNKCDLLEKKEGGSLKRWLPSYGEKGNDVTSFIKCELARIF